MAITIDEIAFGPVGPDRPNGLFSRALWDITTSVESNVMGGKLWASEGLTVSAKTSTADDVVSLGCKVGMSTSVISSDCPVPETVEPAEMSPVCWCFAASQVDVFRSFKVVNGNQNAVEEFRVTAERDVLGMIETVVERDLANGHTILTDCGNPAIFDFEAIPDWALDGAAPVAMTITTALGRLEQLIVENGGGVIHAPYALGTALIRSGLVRLNGTTMSTVMANIPVVLGAGYPAVDIRNGGVAGPGQSWLAATGPVRVLRGQPAVVGPIFDAHLNEYLVRVQLAAMGVWLPTVHATVLVTDQGVCG